MARYRVLELSYFNERIVEPGDEVEFNGIAGANLELIGDAQAARAETLAMLQAEAQALGLAIDKGQDPARLSALIAEAKNRRTN
ncbi:hypothetical protein [Labrys monachus]|uniref:Uncharacterized protein n=1 Tax=Labrys monachus TaxID=217067 RepID=A0ABU0FC47_9HYPH|nr:hypothetical protein [Labrys monachus]MDQ0392180.1 hypothetical protein [Labrys monachus]